MFEFIQVGTIKKTFGQDGGVRFTIFKEYVSLLNTLKHVFLFRRGDHIPYFISKLAAKPDRIFFDSVQTVTEAERLAFNPIFLRTIDLPEDFQIQVAPSKAQFAHLVGWQVQDDNQVIGTIEDVLVYPQQEMAVIKRGEQQLMLPIVDSYIQQIDVDSKLLHVQLPAGFLDLFN